MTGSTKSFSKSLKQTAILSLLMVGTLHTTSTFAGQWEPQTSLSAPILMGVDFLDENVGFVSGGNDEILGEVYMTTDGGQTWTGQVDKMQSATFMDISMANEQEGVAGGLGMFYYWGGASYMTASTGWQASPTERLLMAAYQDVQTLNESVSVLTGMWGGARSSGTGVAISHDGGKRYEHRDWGVDTAARYSWFLSPETGFVSGGNWPVESKTIVGNGNYRLSEHVRMPYHAKNLPEFANYDGYRGSIAKTEDGGKTFKLVYDDFDRFYINQIQFTDENSGWAVAEGPDGAWILHTSDGGNTWDEKLVKEGSASLMALHMIDDMEGWAAGAVFGFGIHGLFLHTVDGGETWFQDPAEDAPSVYLLNIDATDSNNAWAVGMMMSGSCLVLKYTP